MEHISRKLFKGWSVVLVEDDPATRDIVQTTLERYGAQVHTAQNGRIGAELIAALRPQLVITDLDMPILSGTDMVRSLNAAGDLAGIPVIALTARFTFWDQDDMKADGFTHIVNKPISPSRFIRELVGVPALHLDETHA